MQDSPLRHSIHSQQMDIQEAKASEGDLVDTFQLTDQLLDQSSSSSNYEEIIE